MKPTSKGKIPAKSKPCENKKAKGSKDKSKPKKEPKKPKGKSRSGGSKPQKSAGSTNTTPYGEAKTKFAAEYLPYLLYLSFFCWCLRVTRPISRCPPAQQLVAKVQRDRTGYQDASHRDSVESISWASCHLGRNVRGGDEETALQVEITCGRWFNFKCKSSRILKASGLLISHLQPHVIQRAPKNLSFLFWDGVFTSTNSWSA